MNKKLLKIGEMARLNHVSIPTLRLYDELKLLSPSYIDNETGYRYYNIKQNARLDLIQYLKELGMSLSEIKELLDKKDIRQIEAKLILKKKQVKEQIELLELRKNAIAREIENIERFTSSPDIGMITIEYIPHRKIYSMETEINFYDYDIEMYENILLDLKNNMNKNNLPQIYYTNAGTILKKENYLNHVYKSNEIFIFVDDDFPSNTSIKRIESGIYACIYLDNFDDEIEYAEKLLNYCHEHNYIINGDYICEVLTELNFFDNQKRSMYLRLQVPVSFKK